MGQIALNTIKMGAVKHPCPAPTQTGAINNNRQTSLKPREGEKSQGREELPYFGASCKQRVVPKTMLLHKADFPSPGFPVQEGRPFPTSQRFFSALSHSPSLRGAERCRRPLHGPANGAGRALCRCRVPLRVVVAILDPKPKPGLHIR